MKYIMIGKKKFILQNPYVIAFFIALIFTVLCLISFFRTSILSSFSPIAYSSKDDIKTYYDASTRYIRCTVEKLYYTGYDQIKHSKVTGHYYYTLHNDRCTIYIISADYIGKNSQPPLMLENQTFNAKLTKSDDNFKTLLEYMATDLQWNYSGILRHTSTTIIDQSGYNIITYIVLTAFMLLSVASLPVIARMAWKHSDYVLKSHHHEHK